MYNFIFLVDLIIHNGSINMESGYLSPTHNTIIGILSLITENIQYPLFIRLNHP